MVICCWYQGWVVTVLELRSQKDQFVICDLSTQFTTDGGVGAPLATRDNCGFRATMARTCRHKADVSLGRRFPDGKVNVS